MALLQTSLKILRAAELARDLTEPGEPNAEYIRGQVNLICDMTGIPLAGDVIGEELTQFITGTAPASRLLAALQDARRSQRA